MIPREIETERLRLRQFTEDDLKPMATLNSIHEVTQYMGYGVIGLEETWQQVATILGHWQMRGYGPYAVDDKATGGFIGRIGPWYPIDWPDFEVGWMLHPDYWGRGLATEGAKAALDTVFENTDRARVCAVIHHDNAASIRVAEKLGERCLGETPIRTSTALLYGITREEWQALRNKT